MSSEIIGDLHELANNQGWVQVLLKVLKYNYLYSPNIQVQYKYKYNEKMTKVLEYKYKYFPSSHDKSLVLLVEIAKYIV